MFDMFSRLCSIEWKLCQMHCQQLLFLSISQLILLYFLQTLSHAHWRILPKLFAKLQSLLKQFHMRYLQPRLRASKDTKWFIKLCEVHLRLLRLSVSGHMQILLPRTLPKCSESMCWMWSKLQSLHIRSKLFIVPFWVHYAQGSMHKENLELSIDSYKWKMFTL